MASLLVAEPPRRGAGPYPGPRPFQQGESNLFFGRKGEILALCDLVLSYRAVLLYAQSGAGKTSLLDAGLAPKLEGEGCQIFRVRVGGPIPAGVRSEDIQNIYSFNALCSSFKERRPEDLAKSGLEELMACFPEERVLLLILDGFEELFTSHPERWKDRREFFRELRKMLKGRANLRVLFSVREEHIAKLHPYAEYVPEGFRIRYYLERLREKAALEAIVEPVKRYYPERPREGASLEAIAKPVEPVGRWFGAGVAEHLVEQLRKEWQQTETSLTDAEGWLRRRFRRWFGGQHMETGLAYVEGEFIEPVHLQLVCRHLWEKLEEVNRRGEITREDLERFADVDRTLESFYDEALSATLQETRVRESKLRNWFRTSLITTARTRGLVFMEAESTAGIPNRTVNSLEDRHIIRGEARSGGTWYELTHDRFIQPILASDEKWRARRRKRIGWAIVVSSLLLALSLVGFFFHKHQQRNKVIEYFKEMYVVQDLPGQYSLSAWEALGQGDYRRAIEVAEQCTQVLGEQADREQQRLAKSGLQAPPVGVPTMDEALKIAARRPLNTVAGCYLIRGDAAERLQRRDEAREAWLAAAKYTYARSWNPRGFFWSPSQAALERLLR